MLSEWLRSAAALLKSAMDKWGNSSSEGTTSVAKNAAVRIDEIEPGNGPAWGTLSGLTAHPSDASRLYAVTDKDSPPARILEIDVSASSARVVRQMPVIAPGFDLRRSRACAPASEDVRRHLPLARTIFSSPLASSKVSVSPSRPNEADCCSAR